MKRIDIKRALKWWAATLAWAGFIFYLSSRSSFPVKPPFENFDKLVHMGLYGTLCLLLAGSLGVSGFRKPPRIILSLAVLISFLYGISDEMHQAFVPNRSCDPWDAVADGLGALLAALVLGLAMKAVTRQPRGKYN
jgi:VanZ family protein